ncbi:hypothetical protein V8F06_011931 [Rhypophila decipiens]
MIPNFTSSRYTRYYSWNFIWSTKGDNISRRGTRLLFRLLVLVWSFCIFGHVYLRRYESLALLCFFLLMVERWICLAWNGRQ